MSNSTQFPPIGILGFGYLGQAIARNPLWNSKCWVTVHSGVEKETIAPQQYRERQIAFSWDLPDSWENLPEEEATLVLTIPPLLKAPTAEQNRVRQWALWMQKHRPSCRKILYISTTGVYPGAPGIWGEECAEFDDRPKAQLRVVTENTLREFFDVKIVRPGAIYGPGRHIGVRIKNQKPIPAGDQKVHRIHVEDLAQLIWLAARDPAFPPIINAIDREPSTSACVAQWIISQGYYPQTAPIYSENYLTRQGFHEVPERKISNSRLLNIVQFKYLYPTFREGIAAAIKDETFPQTD